MEKERDIIIVPWEFNSMNEVSFQHALQLAKAADNEILLLHISPPKKMFESRTKKDQSIEEIKIQLADLAMSHSKENSIVVSSIVGEGKQERVLNDVIVEQKANLIVTNSHIGGRKRYSDILSLLKTTKRNSIPFIIAEHEPVHSHYIEVVIPIDYDRKFKETVRWVMNMSKYYKCNLNFIKPYYDDLEKKRLMANNIYFTKKMLDSNDIVYGIKTAKKNKVFSDEIFGFASKIDADLVVFMSSSYRRYVLSSRSKFSIDDKSKVPIMCINPMSRKFQGFY